MSASALRARALVLSVVAPHVQPGDRISRQKRLAYDLLRMDDVPAGWSKIEAAWKGRAGAPTLVILEEQAEKCGLPKRETTGVCGDANEHLQRLRAGARKLRNVDPDFAEEYSRALDWIERRAGG